jgi:hypothetical protein
LCLQELQLSDLLIAGLSSDLNNFNNVSCTGVSRFDSSDSLAGRLYGSCAVLWRSDTYARVHILDTQNRRICAVNFTCTDWKLLIINVYLPYESNDAHADEFCAQLFVLSRSLISAPMLTL